MTNIKDKLYNIIDLYNTINKNKEMSNESINENKNILITKNKMNNISSNNKLNEMTIIYNTENKNIIRIFGDDFVSNNKNNCYLLIDEKQNELCQLFKLNDIQKNKNKLEIKLVETKIITNMNSMFKDCSSLRSLENISEWNMSNVTDMCYIFL